MVELCDLLISQNVIEINAISSRLFGLNPSVGAFIFSIKTEASVVGRTPEVIIRTSFYLVNLHVVALSNKLIVVEGRTDPFCLELKTAPELVFADLRSHATQRPHFRLELGGFKCLALGEDPSLLSHPCFFQRRFQKKVLCLLLVPWLLPAFIHLLHCGFVEPFGKLLFEIRNWREVLFHKRHVLFMLQQPLLSLCLLPFGRARLRLRNRLGTKRESSSVRPSGHLRLDSIDHGCLQLQALDLCWSSSTPGLGHRQGSFIRALHEVVVYNIARDFYFLGALGSSLSILAAWL